MPLLDLMKRFGFAVAHKPGSESIVVFNEQQLARLDAELAKPIDMVLHCPECHTQHIDRDETPSDREWAAQSAGKREVQYWNNPPHKSHLCHGCRCIWRPADVPTNGVAAVKTRGKADRWPKVSMSISMADVNSTLLTKMFGSPAADDGLDDDGRAPAPRP